MKFFSDCDNCESCVIHFGGNCIAGHGDNHFTPVTIKDIERLIRVAPDRMREQWKHGMAEEIKLLFPSMATKIDKFMEPV